MVGAAPNQGNCPSKDERNDRHPQSKFNKNGYFSVPTKEQK
jgi:hypothetical protein